VGQIGETAKDRGEKIVRTNINVNRVKDELAELRGRYQDHLSAPGMREEIDALGDC